MGHDLVSQYFQPVSDVGSVAVPWPISMPRQPSPLDVYFFHVSL
jgi:hypothetical protein